MQVFVMGWLAEGFESSINLFVNLILAFAVLKAV